MLVTCDRWHATHGMLHMTPDTWHRTHYLIFFLFLFFLFVVLSAHVKRFSVSYMQNCLSQITFFKIKSTVPFNLQPTDIYIFIHLYLYLTGRVFNIYIVYHLEWFTLFQGNKKGGQYFPAQYTCQSWVYQASGTRLDTTRVQANGTWWPLWDTTWIQASGPPLAWTLVVSHTGHQVPLALGTWWPVWQTSRRRKWWVAVNTGNWTA